MCNLVVLIECSGNGFLLKYLESDCDEGCVCVVMKSVAEMMKIKTKNLTRNLSFASENLFENMRLEKGINEGLIFENKTD